MVASSPRRISCLAENHTSDSESGERGKGGGQEGKSRTPAAGGGDSLRGHEGTNLHGPAAVDPNKAAEVKTVCICLQGKCRKDVCGLALQEHHHLRQREHPNRTVNVYKAWKPQT